MEAAEKAKSGTSQADKSLLMIHDAILKRLEILFITCHGMALNARPYRDFKFHCEMDRAKGLDIGHTYVNAIAAQQSTHYIGEIIRENVSAEMCDAPYLSIIIDGATDAAIKEQELVNAQYASMGVVKTSLVGIEAVEKGDAATIFKAVKELFKRNVGIPADSLFKKNC